MALVLNVVREGLRNRSLYVLTGVWLLLMFLLLVTSGGTVRDAAGNVEGAAVQQAGAGNEFQARFRYVQPANGPFDVDLVLPAGVASITTEPALPIEVTVTEGSTTELSITITGLTAS